MYFDVQEGRPSNLYSSVRWSTSRISLNRVICILTFTHHDCRLMWFSLAHFMFSALLSYAYGLMYSSGMLSRLERTRRNFWRFMRDPRCHQSTMLLTTDAATTSLVNVFPPSSSYITTRRRSTFRVFQAASSWTVDSKATTTTTTWTRRSLKCATMEANRDTTRAGNGKEKVELVVFADGDPADPHNWRNARKVAIVALLCWLAFCAFVSFNCRACLVFPDVRLLSVFGSSSYVRQRNSTIEFTRNSGYCLIGTWGDTDSKVIRCERWCCQYWPHSLRSRLRPRSSTMCDFFLLSFQTTPTDVRDTSQGVRGVFLFVTTNFHRVFLGPLSEMYGRRLPYMISWPLFAGKLGKPPFSFSDAWMSFSYDCSICMGQ